MTFDFDRALRSTPARLDVGRAGVRPKTATLLAFQRDHGAARDAVWSEWHPDFLDKLVAAGFLLFNSAATTRLEYLHSPPLGRRLRPEDLDRIRLSNPSEVDVQLVLSDGLSALAVESHYDRVVPPLLRNLSSLGRLGVPVAIRNGRVAAADAVAAAVQARLVIHLIGERPGLGSVDSLGCYLTFRPSFETTDANRKCISNIRPAGLNPDEAAAVIAGVSRRILQAGTSGPDLAL